MSGRMNWSTSPYPTAAAEWRHGLHLGSRQPIWAAKLGVGPTVEEDQTAIHEMGRGMEHLALRASLSGTFLQTLPDLVTPLKGTLYLRAAVQ